ARSPRTTPESRGRPPALKLYKRFFASAAGQELLARLAYGYMKLVWATGRWRFVGREHGERLRAAGDVALCAFWHGRLAMMGMAWPRQIKMNLMSSRHRDGRLIGRIAELFGQTT